MLTILFQFYDFPFSPESQQIQTYACSYQIVPQVTGRYIHVSTYISCNLITSFFFNVMIIFHLSLLFFFSYSTAANVTCNLENFLRMFFLLDYIAYQQYLNENRFRFLNLFFSPSLSHSLNLSFLISFSLS